MRTNWKLFLSICLLASQAPAADYARDGAQAVLSTFAHEVSGTATIVSSNSIRLDSFSYNGGGPAVYFYLGTNNTQQAFANGIRIGDLLTGMVYANDTVTVSLPGGQTLDGYNAISVWCVDFQANFGSGNFQPYIDKLEVNDQAKALYVSGAPGQVYHLQGSTNALVWVEVATRTNTAGTVILVDTNALPTRLYRTRVE